MGIPILGLAPLLQVYDMPASIGFYCGVLGFEIRAQSEPGDYFDWALLDRHGIGLMLNTAYERDARPPAPDPARVASHEDITLYFGCLELDAAYAELRSHGCSVQPPVVQGYGMRQLYVKDPDGYNLCFQCPASDETRAQWREWYGIDTAETSGA